MRANVAARLAVAVLSICMASGCGFVYPPPATPDIVKKQMFQAREAVAVLTFAPGRTSGKLAGIIHGWPFPEVVASRGIPTGTFTYVGEFQVTARSATDAMPAAAAGSRRVYFHEQENVPLSSYRSFSLGQLAATDKISMTFTFREAHQIVAVRLDSRQASGKAFTYQGRTIAPPSSRNTSEVLEGEYSADYGGYVLSNVAE
jgi:hypothetical protein